MQRPGHLRPVGDRQQVVRTGTTQRHHRQLSTDREDVANADEYPLESLLEPAARERQADMHHEYERQQVQRLSDGVGDGVLGPDE
jgi:hypothetical protein